MLGILQILLSLGFTALYIVDKNPSFNLIMVLLIILIFVVINIFITMLLLLFFTIFIYTTEKIDPKKTWKWVIIHQFSVYLFKFYYRARLIVTGKENLPKNNKFIVVANHIEYTDPIYIMQAYKYFPIGFIAKDPLFKYPIFKNLMYGMGCLPLSKYADRSALKTMLKAIKQVDNGQPMGVFPEGKRTYGNDLIDFKPGAFKLVQKPKADISPVCLYNMHELSKSFRLMPTKIYLHILPIIKYEEIKDLDSVNLSKKVFNIINHQMDKFKNN